MKRAAFQRRLPERPARPDRSAEFTSVVIEPPRARMAVLMQAAGPTPAPKDVPAYSAAWRRAVSELRLCVHCGHQFGQDEGSDPAHRNEGKGMGTKVDDCLTASLCRACHREIDQGRTMTREERRSLIDALILKTLVLLFRSGKVRVTA